MFNSNTKGDAMADYYKEVKHADAVKVPKENRKKTVRLYCFTHGATWIIQVRAPIVLKYGKPGKDFVISTAYLSREELINLRDTCNAALKEK